MGYPFSRLPLGVTLDMRPVALVAVSMDHLVIEGCVNPTVDFLPIAGMCPLGMALPAYARLKGVRPTRLLQLLHNGRIVEYMPTPRRSLTFSSNLQGGWFGETFLLPLG